MKEIIEQLNSLQIGDLVYWKDEDEPEVIGIVTELYDEMDNDLLWRADFPQDGEFVNWGEGMAKYAEIGTLGIVCKSEI